MDGTAPKKKVPPSEIEKALRDEKRTLTQLDRDLIADMINDQRDALSDHVIAVMVTMLTGPMAPPEEKKKMHKEFTDSLRRLVDSDLNFMKARLPDPVA